MVAQRASEQTAVLGEPSRPLTERNPIPISTTVFSGNEEKYVVDAIRSGWVSSAGPYVKRFEADFARFLSCRHAASVANGTVALHLALRALDIGPGDEVIVPAFTFAASVNAIFHAGATPVLADSSSDHWNVDAADVERACTPATKAILAVHLYGHPCDLEALLAVAKSRGLAIVEDAAEAHGATYNGHRVGTLGDIGCFSFFGNKVVTTGEGGMCVTASERLDGRLRKLRDHGMSSARRYWHEEVGYNYRLTNLNAAVGVAQMERIEEFLDRRLQLALLYERELASVSGVRVYASPFGEKIDWMFCLFLTPEFPMSRDELIRNLGAHHIEARPTFVAMHKMPPYSGLRRASDLHNAERFSESGLNLPLYPTLRDEDVSYIANVIRRLASTA